MGKLPIGTVALDAQETSRTNATARTVICLYMTDRVSKAMRRLWVKVFFTEL